MQHKIRAARSNLCQFCIEVIVLGIFIRIILLSGYNNNETQCGHKAN